MFKKIILKNICRDREVHKNIFFSDSCISNEAANFL